MPSYRFLFLIAVCAVGASRASSADAPLGLPAVGEAFHAQLVGAGPAGKLRFSGAGAPSELPLADLALWGAFVEPSQGPQIVLADGSLIVVDSLRIEKEQVRATSLLLGKITVPLDLVAGIIFRPPLDLAIRDQLRARMLAATGETDRVLLDNGDELSGTIVGLDDAKAEPVLQLQGEVGKTEIPADKLAAILFNATLVNKPRISGLRTLVGMRDGSRVTAMEISADKVGAKLNLAGGVMLQLPLDAIVALQVLDGRAVYLSDLKPASYRHIPYLQLSWPFQPDHSVLGSQLRVGGNVYAKGLGMHSPARITYDLDQPYRHFQADVAVDREAQQRGSVVFRVFTDDGAGAWQERAASEVLRGGEPPQPISVDLGGAKKISLLVDFADHGDELDHADWLNARLVR
jgi:hypothetical protein